MYIERYFKAVERNGDVVSMYGFFSVERNVKVIFGVSCHGTNCRVTKGECGRLSRSKISMNADSPPPPIQRVPEDIHLFSSRGHLQYITSSAAALTCVQCLNVNVQTSIQFG